MLDNVSQWAHTGRMPDRDVFPGLHRSWWGIGRAICGEQPAESVSALGEKALADQLRRDPVGVARLADAAAVVAHTGDAGAVLELVDASDLQASPVLRCLQAEARAKRATDDHELIGGALHRMVQGQIDSLRPELVANGRSAAEASAYLQACVAGIRTALIADQIATGRTVRAPRRARAGTADLLHEPLT